jgi:hypothetical protein
MRSERFCFLLKINNLTSCGFHIISHFYYPNFQSSWKQIGLTMTACSEVRDTKVQAPDIRYPMLLMSLSVPISREHRDCSVYGAELLDDL